MNTKICSKCKLEKNLSEFNKNKQTKDKLNCWCNICYKKYKRKYSEKNREKI